MSLLKIQTQIITKLYRQIRSLALSQVTIDSSLSRLQSSSFFWQQSVANANPEAYIFLAMP
jgi:hypothetical protein